MLLCPQGRPAGQSAHANQDFWEHLMLQTDSCRQLVLRNSLGIDRILLLTCGGPKLTTEKHQARQGN